LSIDQQSTEKHHHRAETSATILLQIFEQDRLLHQLEFSEVLELGRQDNGEPDPFALVRPRRRGATASKRLVIAPLSKENMSRSHVELEPLDRDRIRVRNLSEKLSLRLLDDGTELGTGQDCERFLPIRMSIADLVVQVGVEDFDIDTVQTLGEQSVAPGQILLPAGTIRSLPEVDRHTAVEWLRAVISVLESAASSSNFFEVAVQAAIDLVGLDTAGVLMPKGSSWQPVAVCSSRRHGEASLRPSRRILEHVIREKKACWQLPPANTLEDSPSLMDLQAVIAAPILSRNGDVLAIFYGDRRLTVGLPNVPPISEEEAKLVELFAFAVASGLARQQLEQQRFTLEQFFTPELAHQLQTRPDLLDGKSAEVSLLVCDIRGFSRISERLGSTKTVKWIHDIMTEMSDCVQSEAGVVVDYVGDEIMAMWGAPTEQPDHVERAARAAIAMSLRLPELNRRWQGELGEPLAVGIGINSGEAHVGNVGSERRFKFGPLGDTVNIASRVQGCTKYLQCDCLITGEAYRRLDNRFATRRLCQVRVFNISRPVDLYELSCGSGDWSMLKHRYEEALQCFETGDFRTTVRLLGELINVFPEDGPSLVLLSRAVEAMSEPKKFDPVWNLLSK